MNSRKKLLLLGFLFILANGNCIRICDKGSVRTVEFLSIFALGAIAALFLREVIVTIRNR